MKEMKEKFNIPSFKGFMLPIINILHEKNGEMSGSEIRDVLINKWNVPEETLNIMVKTRNESIFYNRLSWAISYLNNGGYIQRTRRGHYKITQKGIENINNQEIDIKYNIKEFEEKNDDNLSEEIMNLETPTEQIEKSFEIIKDNIVEGILSKILEQDFLFLKH